MNKEEITAIQVVYYLTMVHVLFKITLVRQAHTMHNNFQNSSFSLSLYIIKKEEICVKFDLGEFYKNYILISIFMEIG
jgi:hypothetical protein